MVNCQTHNESPEQVLPNGRSIFDLITLKNLDAIRSLLTPLTLHDRQSIAYQKVEGKSLLYYACELGCKDIARYLLVECGADIDDGYYGGNASETPIIASVRKLDVPVITLLMRHGACVRSGNVGAHCVNYAFNNKYNSLVTILTFYGKKMNGIILLRPKPHGNGYSGLFRFFEKGNTEYERRSRLFLNAVTNGGTPTIKMLLSRGINKNYQNYDGENALCLAILNGRVNTENFLINHKTYTLKTYAQALEFCGAKFIIYLANKKRGLECWRKSLRIRQEYCIGFLDKDQVKTESDIGMEFKTKEEIYMLKDKQLYLQALLVFLRLLPRYNEITRTAFRIVAQHRIFRDDLLLCLKLLSELYYYTNVDRSVVRYPTEHSIETMDELFRDHFEVRSEDRPEYLLKFGKLFHLLWGELPQSSLILYDIAYEELLSYVLLNIENMSKYNLSQEERKWIENGITKINEKYSSCYSTTLLHEAIQREFSLSVVALLLKCSSDANCTTRVKNSPLHCIASTCSEDTYTRQVTNLLIKAGAHVDSVNSFGSRPLEALQERGIIDKPLKYLSLQCLAARAIYKHGIAVSEDNYPKILVRFVRIHSS